MIKHKKVKRILIATFMALCLFMGPLASKPKAATAGSGTAVSGSTTVCSYSWTFVNNGIYDIGTDLGIIKSSMHVDIDLTAYYSGALTITLSGTSSFANIGIFVKGGYLATTSTNQCKIQLIANVSHVEVDFISSIEFTSVPNWSVTVSASGINKIDDLEHTSLDNIDDYTGRISAAVTSTTNGVPAIYNELTDIYEALGILSSINNYLAISNMRNSADIPFFSRFAYVNLLRYGTLSDNYLYPYSTQNLGMFPTIETDNYSEPAYNSDYDVYIPAGKTLHFIYTVSYWANIFDFINSSGNSLNPTVTMIEGNNYYRSYDVYYKNTSNSNIFINVAMNRNVNRTVIPLYLGVNIPEEVANLFGMDFENTYTRLLQQINSGISNLGNDQTVIDQSTNTTNNFNTEITKINNIEVNILSGINSKFTDVNTAIDQSGVISGSINNTGIGWANYYSGIVLDNLTIVKYPVYIILIGFVLLCLLG